MYKLPILIISLISVVNNQIPLYKKYTSQYLISVSGSIPQLNKDDYNYYTVFYFGTPGQKLEIIQDTWVGETWINLLNSTYNINSSSSANLSTTLSTYNYSYGVGTVTGYTGTEVITIQDIGLTNLRIPLLFENNGTGRGVQFLKKIIKSNLRIFVFLRYDGSIGLANFKEYKNWLEIAVENNLLGDSQFAFDLRNQGENSYFYAGSQSFPISQNSLKWLNVLSEHWAIGNFTSTIIEGTTYPQPENSKQAVWDSGFAVTFIGANAYNGLLNAELIQKYCQLNTQLTLYMCTCNQAYPDLIFNMPDTSFSLIHQDYMFQLQGGYCVLSVDTNPETWVPFMVFGEGMFRNYFVAYDKTNQKIGFSKFDLFYNFQLVFFRDTSQQKNNKFLSK